MTRCGRNANHRKLSAGNDRYLGTKVRAKGIA